MRMSTALVALRAYYSLLLLCNMDIRAFLDSAGVGHLAQRMLEEEVTLDILLQANDGELSELTTKVADKIKLRSSLEKIRHNNASFMDDPEPFSPSSNSCSSPVPVALPKRQSILILGPNGTLEGTPLEICPSIKQITPVKPPTTIPATPVQPPTIQVTPVQPPQLLQDREGYVEPKEFSFTLEDGEIDFFKDIDTNTIEETIQQPSLINLLSKNTRGKLLVEKAKKGQSLTSRDRGYIVSLIVEAELQSLQKLNQTIRKDVWQKWSNDIVTLFKGESKELYYVPYHIVGGKVVQASGLIHNRLITHRRSLTENTKAKKRKNDSSETSDSGCSSTSLNPKRVRPLPDEFHQDFTSEDDPSEDNLDWLRGASHPREILLTKWRATFELRAKLLRESSYIDYFTSFPGLKLPNGYELLTADFEAVYPSANKTYQERFPLVKLKLLKLLADRAESSKPDETILELLELASVGEEQANSAALLGIIALLRQMHTIAVPKKKLWRLSRHETSTGFLARVASASEIATYCQQREAFNLSKGIVNQPYILAVGPSWANIHVFEIVTTAGGLRYQVSTICEAIKVTYNLYWALDLAYSKVAAPCWMFIQRAIFQMKSKFDSEGVPLRELLSQLNSLN